MEASDLNHYLIAGFDLYSLKELTTYFYGWDIFDILALEMGKDKIGFNDVQHIDMLCTYLAPLSLEVDMYSYHLARTVCVGGLPHVIRLPRHTGLPRPIFNLYSHKLKLISSKPSTTGYTNKTNGTIGNVK